MVIENYAVPESVAEAARLLQGGAATIVAGGTDLTPQTRTGAKSFAATLVNIQRVPEMRGIQCEGDRYRIGGLATVTDVLESAALATDAPVLVAAADHFASSQIRNAATLAGNLCNASPAGDMCIPLLLLDAEVELASWADDAVKLRVLPLAEFFTAPGKTRMRADELLTAIEFDRPAAAFRAIYLKSGPRPALEISTVSLGAAANVNGGRAHGVRIAIGAAAPTPLRARATEELIEGRELDAALIEEAAQTAVGEVAPIDDVRASSWYRQHLTAVYTRRALNHVAGH